MSKPEPTPDAGLRTAVEALHRHLPPIAAALYPIRKPVTEGGPALWLLPAGCRGGGHFQAYVQQVQAFDWTDFYASCHGAAYFEWMREQLLGLADVVLIDSRTGVTEMGGVCARQMAVRCRHFASAETSADLAVVCGR